MSHPLCLSHVAAAAVALTLTAFPLAAQCEVDQLLPGPNAEAMSGAVVMTAVDGNTRLLTWLTTAQNHSLLLYERTPVSGFEPIQQWNAGTDDPNLRIAMDGRVVAWSSLAEQDAQVAVQRGDGTWAQPVVPDLAMAADQIVNVDVHWVDGAESFTMVVGEASTTDLGWVHQLRGDADQVVHSTSFPAPFAASVNDIFGFALAITGDTLAVGAPNGDLGGDASGQLYLFRRMAGSTEADPVFDWTIAYFEPGSDHFFGRVVDADGDHVMTASRYVDTASYTNLGSVNFYTWDGATFVHDYEHNNPSPGHDVGTGVSCAISGGRAIAGVKDKDYALQYSYTGTHWTHTGLLHPELQPPTVSFDFGDSVAISGERAAVLDPSSQISGKPGAIHGYQFFGEGQLVSDPSYAMPAGPGAPTLAASGVLCGGGSLVLLGSDVQPSSTAYLVFGLAALNAPFKGGTMYPDPLLILPMPTNSLGDFGIVLEIPANLPTFTMLIQAWTVDPDELFGFSATNGLAATFES